MKLMVEFECDSDAFVENFSAECMYILGQVDGLDVFNLKETAKKFGDGYQNLFDSNGNVVGRVALLNK